MTIEQQWEIAGWADLLVPVLATLLLLLFCPRPRGTGSRLALSVFIGWIFAERFHAVVVQPICIQRARADGDYLYDGTGGGAATLLFGWFVPLVSALLALGVRALWRRFRPTTTDEPNSKIRNA